jgi:hypothetical protein
MGRQQRAAFPGAVLGPHAGLLVTIPPTQSYHASIYCKSCLHATLPHALLQCSAFTAQQTAFWRSLTGMLREVTVAQLRELPAAHQLLCILGDAEWGPLAVGMDVVVQRYLLDLQAAQAQYAVVAGGVGQADQACRVCMRRDGPTMLLCDGCDSGCYHLKCLVPRVYRVPSGDWLCSECFVATPVGKRPLLYYALLPCGVCCSRGRGWCVMAVIRASTCTVWG